MTKQTTDDLEKLLIDGEYSIKITSTQKTPGGEIWWHVDLTGPTGTHTVCSGTVLSDAVIRSHNMHENIKKMNSEEPHE